MDQHDDRPVPLQEADGTSRTAQPPRAGLLLGSTLGVHPCRADFAGRPAGLRRFARAGSVVPGRHPAACRRGLCCDAAPGSGPRGRDAAAILASADAGNWRRSPGRGHRARGMACPHDASVRSVAGRWWRYCAAGVSHSGAGALLGRNPRHHARRGGWTCCVIASGPAGADRVGAGVGAGRKCLPDCRSAGSRSRRAGSAAGCGIRFARYGCLVPANARFLCRASRGVQRGGGLHSTAPASSRGGQSGGHAAMGDRSFAKLGAGFCRPGAPPDRSAAGAADVGAHRSRGAAAGPASGL